MLNGYRKLNISFKTTQHQQKQKHQQNINRNNKKQSFIKYKKRFLKITFNFNIKFKNPAGSIQRSRITLHIDRENKLPDN